MSHESLRSRLEALSRNLYWTWRPGFIAAFRDLDPSLWRKVNHNPIALLDSLSDEQLATKAKTLALDARVTRAFEELRTYEQGEGRAREAGTKAAGPIAYFSAEFGLHESLPLYAGGLGVLAGDHLKAASDAGLDMVGVGLFYARGYFRQELDDEGWQQERSVAQPIDQLPIRRARNADGEPYRIELPTRRNTVKIALWSAKVGRTRLVLLDTDHDGNDKSDRELTCHLYDDDPSLQVRKQYVLGVGGLRALAAMGVRPAVLHLNEGHCTFAALEWVRWRMAASGASFDDARAEAGRTLVFTTHTPVEAGHDRYEPTDVEQAVGPLRDELGISKRELFDLGRTNDGEGPDFGMTSLGLRLAGAVNAVSREHGRVSRWMWSHLWPERAQQETPIGEITNGVHVASWIAIPMHDLLSRRLGDDWSQRIADPDLWQQIDGISDEEFWEHRQILKTHLVAYVHRHLRLADQHREKPIADAVDLDPDVLTIGFARRLASYKRHDLLLRDLDRLAALVANDERPIQLLFAGKAHPANERGKHTIQRLFNLMKDDRFKGRVAFLENHDFNVARHLAQGVDAWLNLPRRTREACGTSGQKIVLNGGLNISVRDGWWAEAFGEDVGFAVGPIDQPDSIEQEDAQDHHALFHVLEQFVAPLYYERDEDDVPRGWVRRQKAAIRAMAARFSASRMIDDYIDQCYRPALEAAATFTNGGHAPEVR